MSSKILETMQIVPVMTPVDLHDAATTGAYVSLANYGSCLCVLLAGDGTGGSDVAVELFQAVNVAGDQAKVLNALITGRIYTKEHATTLAAVGQWTKATQAVADEAYAPDDSGEHVLLWAFEVRASDLDQAGGFDCLRMDLTAPGAAKLGAALYLLCDPRYAKAPEDMPSAIVD